MAGAAIRSRIWGVARIARAPPFPPPSPLHCSFSIAVALASLPGSRKGSSFFLLAAAHRKSKDCSSGACERNWSAHALVHTKRRNRLSTRQIERLIYCRENMCIMHKFENLTGPMQAWQHLPQLAIVNTRGFAAKGKKRKSLEGDNPGNEKEAALQAALDQIASTFGKETVMWLGRNAGPRFVPVISTGSLGLDVALGIGGLPKGRVVEIYGPEASGKTTLALHCIAEAQKCGGYCVFIDAEHALDYGLAEAIGVKTENLLLAQPDCCEQALNLTDTFIRSGSIDIIVVDSVAALVPRAELEGQMGDSHMALQARLMSQALRKLAHALSRSQTILIFINQTRSKMSTFGFGGPVEVTSGGNALKFYASLRLNIRRIKLIQKGEEAIGSLVNVKVVKNKLAPPFKTAEFEIEFGKGISKEGEIIDQAVKLGLLGKNGGWYSYNGVNIANGKENLKGHLREHEELRESLVSSIKEKLMGYHDEVDEHEDTTEEGSDQEYKQVIVNIDGYDNMAAGGDQ